MRSNERSDESNRVPGAGECADLVHDALPSADLEELAEQLRADALHLVDRYPANRSQCVPAPRRRSIDFKVPLGGVAAAVLIAAGLWSTWSLAPWHKSKADLDGVAAAAPEVVGLENPGHVIHPTANAGSEPIILPTMSFRDLTAAEQEALMDLLDDDEYAARLSI